MGRIVALQPSHWAALPQMILSLIGGVQLGLTLNFWWLILSIPLVWRMIYLACWYYILDEDTEVISETKGVFSTEKVEVHYFRIKSIKVVKPFFLRIFGLSNVEIITSEPFKPRLLIYAVKDGDELAEALENAAVIWREKRGVKEADFHHF